jgi:hypothetical protein
LAVEESPARANRARALRARSNGSAQGAARTAPRPAAVIPIAPPRNPFPRPGSEPVPTTEHAAGHDAEHDPHRTPIGRLPLSVLVGMALMPFGIPLLWFVTPYVTGQEAALSMAVPISLAVAASALCLGVVYTIDWTGTTRVKGVLMLVGLAYLSAAGLYFLKKDLVDSVQRLGMGDPNRWNDVTLDGGSCKVKMPGRAFKDDRQPLAGVAHMSEGRRAQYLADPQDGPQYEYLIALGKPNAAAGKRDDDAWFNRVGEKLKEGGGTLVEGPKPIPHEEGTGRQWTFKFADNKYRIVQVFAIKDRVYFLSAEGPNLTTSDEYGAPFFGKFHVK